MRREGRTVTSAAQVARLLALVPYLQAHPDATVDATAEVFAVTPRQLMTDLNVLWFCGLPGGMPGDLIEVDMDGLEQTGRIRLTNAEFLSRPMRFTADEALSLIVALRAVQEISGSQLGGAAASALAKLESVRGSAAAQVSVEVATGRAEIRDRLAAAIDSGRAVRLTYDGVTRAETTTPLVEPARLTVRDGYAYLQAWSLDRSDWRTYRLDRIADVSDAGSQGSHRGDPPHFDAGWLERRPDAGLVRLQVAESARWIIEYYPTRQVQGVGTRLQVDLLVADSAWLRTLLLRLGPQVLEVEPPEAGDSARDAAREALELYAAYPAQEPAPRA